MHSSTVPSGVRPYHGGCGRDSGLYYRGTPYQGIPFIKFYCCRGTAFGKFYVMKTESSIVSSNK